MDDHLNHLNLSILEDIIMIFLIIQALGKTAIFFQSLTVKLSTEELHISRVFNCNLCFITFLKYTYSYLIYTFGMETWDPKFTINIPIRLRW